ncbi:D-aminoacyl-tRNA deacylase [Pseudoruegeria sp. SK021]|uniref:D-aminoacyl-tRNA deacylase n=1 Tax=Pseudoruegeria sp. SK021 TaxID=1933035 RepID=UPI000A21AADA|nr:D-aminoacyl-tRNA deacylase [Pseudoruegeria sp. SK021]OSP54978.1 D-tyrosyl-tRNA(Tyr) deacylase [Pseudoruegeria sp. SK021]
MRALIQRVSSAEVRVADTCIGAIGPGLVILVCAMAGDSDSTVAPLAAKIAKLKIFSDEAGKMNRSVLDTGGAVLVVSQFTLAADIRSGNRPGFSHAAAPADGKRLYEAFVHALSDLSVPVETGEFGADMAVHLINDGPVTIWMDTAKPA